jgi:hypothetical protein
MLRRMSILTFGLCLIGALSTGCGSDQEGPGQGHAGASGAGNGDPHDQQTGSAGAPGAGGFAGGSAGMGNTAGHGGAAPSSGASVQFVLKEVH